MSKLKEYRTNTAKPRNYLIGLVISVLMLVVWCIPLAPIFIKWFIPFPALESTTKITGHLDIDNTPRVTKNSILPSRYYIVNETGRYEVHCGLPTRHHGCFESDTYSQDASGTVWVDPIFGLVQWDMVMKKAPFKGHSDQMPYYIEKNYFESKFDYSPYKTKSIPLLIWLFAAIYYGVKYSKLRKKPATFQKVE